MKQKILDAIKAKFPTAKLSAKRLDALAATIEAKAGTDETLIDSTLDALNELYPLTEIAKDDHIRSTLEGKLKATQTKKEDPTETPAEKLARETAEAKAEAEKDDSTPSYVKKMFEKLDAVTGELAQIKGEKVATTIKSKLEKELLKDVPVDFWDEWKLPETEDALPAFAEKVTTKFAAINQQRTEAGLGALAAPKGGSGGGGGDNKAKASKEEIAAVVENIM